MPRQGLEPGLDPRGDQRLEVDVEVLRHRSPRIRSSCVGDRACLALACRLGLPALTADRAWKGLAVGTEVGAIR